MITKWDTSIANKLAELSGTHLPLDICNPVRYGIIPVWRSI